MPYPVLQGFSNSDSMRLEGLSATVLDFMQVYLLFSILFLTCPHFLVSKFNFGK